MLCRLWVASAAVLLLFACAPKEKIPPPPAPEAVPAPPPVLPADGRLLVEAGEYPWSAVGRVNTGGRGHCTGILVGPSQVLATAPCLYNATEGRWWHRSEIHFVAGYQRDTYQADSPVAGYLVAPDFTPGGGLTLMNVANNWAVVVLADPIGHRAGWLGLRRLDGAVRTSIRLGEALVLPVGYRRGRAHAITLNLGCDLGGAARPGSGADCAVLPYDATLPPLLFSDGAFRAAGEQLPDGRSRDGALAEALRSAGLTAFEGRGPRSGGRVSPVPLATIDFFLGHLGYLAPGTDPAAGRAAAIRAFQARMGLAVDGRPSIALLGYLIWAAQPVPPVS
jgi:protease YdgD